MIRMASGNVWLGLCAGLFTAACAAKMTSRLGHAPCGSSADCGRKNLICFESNCIATGTAPPLQVEVTPGGGRYKVTDFPNRTFPSSGVLDFEVLPPTHVQGSVLRGGVAPMPLSDVEIVLAQDPALLPDRLPLTFQGRTAASTGAFDLLVSPGRYAVTLLPPNGEPTQSEVAITITASGTNLQIPLPGDDAIWRLSGTVVALGVPVAFASVIAVDDLTRAPLAQAIVTDGAGKFSRMLLPENPPPFRLRVAASPKAPLLPTFADSEIVPVDPSWSAKNPVSVDQDVGAFGAATTLTGRVHDADGNPIPSAEVRVATAAIHKWHWSGFAVTDAVGLYSLVLPLGTYDITALPPPHASSQMLVQPLEMQLQAGTTTLDISCPPRQSIGPTHVFDADGNSVAGAVVTAERQADNLVPRRTYQAVTDDGGAFTVALDPGDYVVSVDPPSDSAAPRLVIGVSKSGPRLSNLTLPAAAQIHGTVSGENAAGKDDAALAGATIDFYILSSDRTRSTLVARTVADAQGHYAAIVPSIGK